MTESNVTTVVPFTGSVRCGTCTSPDRDEIENAIMSGQQLRSVARHHEISESSLRRHVRAHLMPGIRKAAELGQESKAITYLERLSELLEDIASVRASAMETGSYRNALGAIDAESKLILLLAKRFGVDDTAVTAELRELDFYRHTLGRVSLEHPESLDWLISAATANGAAQHHVNDLREAQRVVTARLAKRGAQANTAPPPSIKGMQSE